MIARLVKPMISSLDTTGRATQPASLPANPLKYQKNLQETNKTYKNTKKPLKKPIKPKKNKKNQKTIEETNKPIILSLDTTGRWVGLGLFNPGWCQDSK